MILIIDMPRYMVVLCLKLQTACCVNCQLATSTFARWPNM